MNRAKVARICLGIATVCLISSQGRTQASPPIDPATLQVQVILDRLGFSPGVIDGRQGMSLQSALSGFQASRGLPVTGTLDAATKEALRPYAGIAGTRTLGLTAADIAGPYSGPIPKNPAAQAKLPALGYVNIVERLAEKFHTTPDTLVALNPGVRLAAGAKLVFPNALPSSRAYPDKLPEDWRRTLSDLNIDPNQPQAKRIVVDKSEGVLKVYDKDDRLVAQFPATMGSAHDPLPIGTWKIQGASYNPPFFYNSNLFWDAKFKNQKQKLPPGPNGPVGVVWLDINKPHYGIHGTPEPSKIGRTESHGCIRLTNWDAARLSLMVKPGTPAIFQP